MTGFRLLIGGGRSAGKSSVINFLTSGLVSAPFPRGVKGRLSKLNSIQHNQVDKREESHLVSYRIDLSIGIEEKSEFQLAVQSDQHESIMLVTAHDLILHVLHDRQVHPHTELSLSIFSTKATDFSSIIEIGDSALEVFAETGDITKAGLGHESLPNAYIHITSAIKPLAFLERQAIKRFREAGVPVLLLVNKCDLVDDVESLNDVIQFIEAFCEGSNGAPLPHYFSTFGKDCESSKHLIDVSTAAQEIRRFCQGKSSWKDNDRTVSMVETSPTQPSDTDTEDIYKAISEIAGLTTRDESVVKMILECIGRREDANAASLIRMHKPHPDIARLRIIGTIMERDRDRIRAYAKEMASKYGLVEKVLIQQIGLRGPKAVIQAIERDISRRPHLSDQSNTLPGDQENDLQAAYKSDHNNTAKRDLSRVSLLTTYTKNQTDEKAPEPWWQSPDNSDALTEKLAFPRYAQKTSAELGLTELIDSDKDIEEQEFRQLVDEIKSLGFTRSAEVSSYIRKHRLGNKYKNISGVLKMEMDGEEWDFEGGFPPRIYARLCDELNLTNKSSRAQPKNFTPYKDIL